MNILKYIKTFLHYISVPLRIVLVFLTYIIFYKIGEYCETPTTQYMFALMLGKTLMYLFGINVEIDDADLVRYSQYMYSDKKFLAVFNHTSLIDGFLLMGVFERYSCLFLKNPVFKLTGYSDLIHKKYRNIYVEKNKTTKDIQEHVSSRKAGQSVLFIAPGAGNIPKDPDSITEFYGNGAFVGKFSILPVVIKYEDESIHHNKDNGESFIHSMMKLFVIHNNYKIKLKIGDMIEPKEEESIAEYKQRAYDIMNGIYKDMQI